MVGGQAMDLESEGRGVIDRDQLENIHRAKTGALIRAAVLMGGLIGRANPTQTKNLEHYSKALGLAFQVADDVLDVTSDSATLGKTAGKDIKAQKATYPSIMGLAQAQAYAQKLSEEALGALRDFDNNADALRQLAQFTVTRVS